MSLVVDFISSLSIWRIFLYHTMLITLGLYIGVSEECDLHFRDIRWAEILLICLDFMTLYLNSMMATPYYKGDMLMGVGNAINYFSSYNNPLGITMADKQAWLIYLAIRVLLALVLILLLYLPLLRKRKKEKLAY